VLGLPPFEALGLGRFRQPVPARRIVLYPLLDTGFLARLDISLAQALATALDSGVDTLQIRHKGSFDRDFALVLERCATLALNYKATLILNDRADYAALCGMGLHVGQDDLPPAAARRILGPQAIIGYSTHNGAQLAAAANEPISYAALGPIFPTQSKENPSPVVGLEGLRQWRSLCPLPLVAIGGITIDNAPQVIAAGANKVAILSALWQAPYTLNSFGASIQQWRKTLATQAL
jgi:thiamine-phosphate pyrophosphorylase